MRSSVRYKEFFSVLSIGLAAFTTEAPAAGAGECQRYARGAVEEFQNIQRRPSCRTNVSARWQPNYENHYNWCLSAPREWLRSEAKARDDHLIRCGARIRMAEPELRPAE